MGWSAASGCCGDDVHVGFQQSPLLSPLLRVENFLTARMCVCSQHKGLRLCRWLSCVNRVPVWAEMRATPLSGVFNVSAKTGVCSKSPRAEGLQNSAQGGMVQTQVSFFPKQLWRQKGGEKQHGLKVV